jgi:predicted MFS family arabinose efflux permease
MMSLATHAPDEPASSAVISMSLGIVGAELLPASLLTPMAADSRISEGLVGQAVTVTAGVAVFASLCIVSASGAWIARRSCCRSPFFL